MSSSKAYDDMSKEEKSAHDTKERERESSEQAGSLDSPPDLDDREMMRCSFAL